MICLTGICLTGQSFKYNLTGWAPASGPRKTQPRNQRIVRQTHVARIEGPSGERSMCRLVLARPSDLSEYHGTLQFVSKRRVDPSWRILAVWVILLFEGKPHELGILRLGDRNVSEDYDFF